MFLAADAVAIGVTVVVLGALFALAEVLYRSGVHGERTRKLVHIGAGPVVLAMPWVLHDVRTMWILTGGFGAALVAARSRGWLPSLHAVARRSWGTVLYPVGIVGAVALTWDHPAVFLVAVTALALGDGLAALVGQRWGRRLYAIGDHARSLEGSATLLAVTAVTGAVALPLAGLTDVASAIVAASAAGLLVVAVEGIAPHGLDNVTVPVAAAWLLHRVVTGATGAGSLALGAAVVLAVCLVSVRRRNVTVSGAMAAGVVGLVVVTVGGWGWLLAVLLVFVAVNVASRIAMGSSGGAAGGAAPRKGSKPLAGKGATRDHVQILCNVGAAVPSAVLWEATGEEAWRGAFLGAVAFAAADTLASELGVLSKAPPISITTLRRVPTGESGGVSALGYLAAAAGGLLPPLGLAAQAGTLPVGWVVASVVAGLVGCTVDSVLGDLLQVRYRCVRCSAVVESPAHCGQPAVVVRGLPVVDNDLVNLLGSLAGAAVGAAIVVAL
jgi:uncharacterized protein (TIGR00297 family)